jgi:hypothetical protein
MTAPTTIESMMYALRERGLSCLQELNSRDRLARCDAAAMKQITERLLNMGNGSKGRLKDWPVADVEKVLVAWKKNAREKADAACT